MKGKPREPLRDGAARVYCVTRRRLSPPLPRLACEKASRMIFQRFSAVKSAFDNVGPGPSGRALGYSTQSRKTKFPSSSFLPSLPVPRPQRPRFISSCTLSPRTSSRRSSRVIAANCAPPRPDFASPPPESSSTSSILRTARPQCCRTAPPGAGPFPVGSARNRGLYRGSGESGTRRRDRAGSWVQ